MTKSLSFESMEDMLLALRNRLACQGKQLKEFEIDNCCSLRQKLQSVFGAQLHVYLDIFHAVQRISTKIPKRHPYYYECLKSLQLVFRDPSDQGSVRMKVTPPPHVLRQQMCMFQETWKDMEFNGKKILPPLAMKEIRCLLVHMERGCLSGIHPSRGTERLHKDINAHMKNSQYGVELAYALISVSLFKHNENIRAKQENRFVAPIRAFKSSINDDSESFGICTKSTLSEPLTVRSHDLKVEMNALQYQELQEMLSSIDINAFEVESLQAADVIPDEAFTMLKQAISAYYVSSTLSKITTTASFNSANAFSCLFYLLLRD